MIVLVCSLLEDFDGACDFDHNGVWLVEDAAADESKQRKLHEGRCHGTVRTYIRKVVNQLAVHEAIDKVVEKGPPGKKVQVRKG